MSHRLHHYLLLVLWVWVVILSLELSTTAKNTVVLAVAPTRVDPTPLPPPTRTPDRKPQRSERVPVATLLLTVPISETQLFSVVQWQDVTGRWHDVNGWRGTISGGRTSWWVEEKDWGASLFRWVVYQQKADTEIIIAISEPFVLPTYQGEVKQIKVQW